MAEKNGVRSKHLCSKYHQLATTYQLDNKFRDAIEAIQKAIDIHKNPTEKDPEVMAKIQAKMTADQKVTVDYNLVIYTAFLSNTNFIEGNYDKAMQAADDCIELCDKSNKLSADEGGTEPLVVRATAQIAEMKKLQEKAKARIDGVSLLSRRQVQEKVETKSPIMKYDFTQALTVFLSATAVSFGAFMAYDRMK